MAKQKKSLFRERDLARALKVAKASGLAILSACIGADGSIVLNFGAPPQVVTAANPWD